MWGGVEMKELSYSVLCCYNKISGDG
jgi:hypothetical protein